MRKMTTITIEVPDELSAQLKSVGNRLPELLARSLRQPVVPNHVYHYVLDFIASQPTPEQIAAFRATPEMIERTQFLIAREHSGTATAAEKAELDEYERIQHIIVMLKAGNLTNISQPS
jgi:hypothetical protein